MNAMGKIFTISFILIAVILFSTTVILLLIEFKENNYIKEKICENKGYEGYVDTSYPGAKCYNTIKTSDGFTIREYSREFVPEQQINYEQYKKEYTWLGKR